MRKIRVIITVFIIISFLMSGHTIARERASYAFHYKDKVIVLIYHAFAPEEKDITISGDRLRSHLQALRNSGYRFISMDDFLLFKQKAKKVPDNAVLLTIDDGYESVYTEAYPIFREFGVPATTFVVVHSTDKPVKNTEYPHLSWEQMRLMADNGMSFYSHTYDLHGQVAVDERGTLKPAMVGRIYHPAVRTTESEESYRARIQADLQLADQRLRMELGNRVNLLALPFGCYTDEALQIGRNAGIPLFFTTKPGINDDNSDDLIRRINAGSAGITGDQLLQKLRIYDQTGAR